ncbi:recombinase family protein [bacterium]|jgi:site-specific DNA recombinase|nr:recombinase family protein [bacterium]
MKTNNKKQNRAALYIRVSSNEISEDARHDDTRHCDPESQKNVLRQFCKMQGYTVDDQHIYEDVGYSGVSSVDERPALKRLVKNAKKKKFDVVVVYRLDRLARNLKLSLGILGDLSKHGVVLKSVSEPLDTSSAFGRSTMYLMLMFAEYEQNVIEDRKRRCRC